MGTVMGWVDKKGVRHQTLVLDASYRNVLPWASTDYDNTYLPNFSSYSTYLNYYLCTPIGGSSSTWNSATTEDQYPGIKLTDSILNSYSGYWEDTNTSNFNTEQMMKYSYSSGTGYAAGWCRSIKILINNKYINMDLPNIQTLQRIKLSIFSLDKYDTSTTNKGLFFTKAKTGASSNWTFSPSPGRQAAWSSTDGGSGAWDTCENTGCWHGEAKTYKLVVIPILELELIS